MSTGTFLISGIACIALALFLVHSPLLALDLYGVGYGGVVRDGLSAGLLLLVTAALRLPARPGAAFGCLAALGLAPAVSYAIAALLAMHPALSLLGGAGLSLLMIPVLRERGTLSLALVALMVGLALVGARRQSLVIAAELGEIQQLAAMVQEGGLRRHFISVDGDYPAARRRSLALSLWPEDPARRIDLLFVEADSEVEYDLTGEGWRGLRIEARGIMILEPRSIEQAHDITFRRAELSPAGPSLVVEQELRGSYLLRVLTPCGSLRQVYEQAGGLLQLSPERLAQYQMLVADLPSGMPILLRLEASFGIAKSAWTLLRIPEHP